MSRRTWIEVALNGAWSRRLQPNIPVKAAEVIAEGIACVEAGAAIVHCHTLDSETSRQNNDIDNCVALIQGIRARVDAIVYPTALPIPLPENDADARYGTTVELARRGLLEWGFLDPGSCNLCEVEPKGLAVYGTSGRLYNNPPELIEAGIRLAVRHRFHPAYACYEPGFVRFGAALHRRYPTLPAPVYRFMFSSSFTFGFPPETWALEACVELLDSIAPGSPWMAAGLGVDVLRLIPRIVELGGHVRVGLEDAPLQSTKRNIELVEAAAHAIRAAGSKPATAAEVRAHLADIKPPRR